MENKKKVPKWVKITTLSLMTFTAFLAAISSFPSCSNNNTAQSPVKATKASISQYNVDTILHKLQSPPFNYVFSEKKEGTMQGVYTGWNTELERNVGSLDDNHVLLAYDVNTHKVSTIDYTCNKLPQHPSMQEVDDAIKFLSNFDSSYANFVKNNFQRFLTDQQFTNDHRDHKVASGYSINCYSQLTAHDFANYFEISLAPVK